MPDSKSLVSGIGEGVFPAYIAWISRGKRAENVERILCIGLCMTHRRELVMADEARSIGSSKMGVRSLIWQ